ncbi:Crp/Fnr family transcriptional regulator [Siphonobacter sp. SORGH_AS_1065]|uniref:Crp/Fnr family transcriptional regulator n=1 Tax=Siphonobacter sp. SORGH_AS_1065 TaxID=3041795 RepID=UPI00278AE1A0|nr:Crp/Fnr family transcriptional regulator [Siphonobacter sp. SORGH_AS_1065]MDQ1090222.1 CRP-like cAMP-binding protein [Siphonobacter sp. SORGH_AS_1065]
MLEKLKNILPFDDKQWNQYASYFKRIQVPAKTVLIQEGEISKKAFFIEKGCIRVWFNNDGKDITFQFFFENERVSSVESFKKNIPSIVTLETIEPSTLWVIDKQDMDQIMRDGFEIPKVREKLIDTLFDRNIHYMKHCLSFIRDTPQQRYLHLLETQPQIIQRIPQHYIASYLGITTVHLSRVKSKLLKGK